MNNSNQTGDDKHFGIIIGLRSITMSDSLYNAIKFSSKSSPPNNALKLGNQTDGTGYYWIAVANTDQGAIPGKAQNGNCWYAYGEKEYFTNDFVWVTSDRPVRLEKNQGYTPELRVLSAYQTDGAGYHYAAVANTEWGSIPGKAKDGTCWYPYGGKEYYTKDFNWVVLDG